MGREVRRVPVNWEHPKKESWQGEGYKPLHNDFKKDLASFEKMLLEKGARYATDYYGGTPCSENYMDADWSDEERTHYQMYENVSEGTPVSPVFATAKELAQYLADNGDFGYQKGGSGRLPNASYEAWLRVCNGGYAPSMVFTPGKGLQSGVEALTPDK